MLSRVLFTTLSVLQLPTVFSISSSVAGEPYSYVSTGIGCNRLLGHEEGFKQNKTRFIEGTYQLGATPFIVLGGYAYDKSRYSEQYSDTEMANHTYFMGGQLLLKPTSRLHLLPGVSYGQFRHIIHSQTGDDSLCYPVYNLGLDANYHIKNGLWGSLGYSRPFDKHKFINRTGFGTLGLDYEVPGRQWGLSLQYRHHHLQESTQLFLKFFL